MQHPNTKYEASYFFIFISTDCYHVHSLFFFHFCSSLFCSFCRFTRPTAIYGLRTKSSDIREWKKNSFPEHSKYKKVDRSVALSREIFINWEKIGFPIGIFESMNISFVNQKDSERESEQVNNILSRIATDS